MNINHEIKLHNDVMMRVKTVKGLRMLITFTFIFPILMIALIVWAGFIVSFGDVVANTIAHENVLEAFSYMYLSVVHSTVIVQTLSVLITLLGLTIAFSFLRKIKIPIWHLFRFRA